ncbi:MAG TPA: MFS transporter [Candidatus Didemnitutus sp.]|nr:MFS transporter [Candidatus Didemnitutus sp.]
MPRPESPTAHPAAEEPSRARRWVIVLAVALAVVQYIDRVCISQAAPQIMHDLGLTEVEMGMVFSAFTFAYALFEIPSGWLGDRIGPRRILLRVVLWWSAFTAATGAAWNLGSMVVIRFLFGAGEAGCFPNLTKAFSAWLPPRERTRVQALMWMGARWGGASAPLLVVAAMSFLSWRMAFVAFAVLGVAWAAVFGWWFRDNPREHPGVNAGERALLAGNEVNAHGHADVPWRRLVRSRSVWLLGIQYGCLSYGWYFYITWLPSYLREVRGLEIAANPLMAWIAHQLAGWLRPETTQAVLAAALTGIPLLAGGFGSLAAGAISSALISSTGKVTQVRRLFGFAGLTGAAGLLLLSYSIRDPILAMLSMGLASFCNDMTLPGSWAACMDVGGRYSGTVSGSMNMLGNIGGMAAPIVVGKILKWTGHDWRLAFVLGSVVYFLGALCWLGIDPVTPLDPSDARIDPENPVETDHAADSVSA